MGKGLDLYVPLARNVLDTLDRIRLLKEHSVCFIFAKEVGETNCKKDELTMILLAAIAPEKSRSILRKLWASARSFYSRELLFVPTTQ